MYQAGFGGTLLLNLPGLQQGAAAHLLKRGCKGNKKWEKLATSGVRENRGWDCRN